MTKCTNYWKANLIRILNVMVRILNVMVRILDVMVRILDVMVRMSMMTLNMHWVIVGCLTSSGKYSMLMSQV